MERYRTCPICFEVPIHEIFQCENGHIICGVCEKSIGENCPTCRVPFGERKIRNRALEEVLDEQEFPCKFQEKGCKTLIKRAEILRHERLCEENPDYIPLCKMIGNGDCKFSPVFGTRAEVVDHFKNSHGALYKYLRTSSKKFGVELDDVVQNMTAKNLLPRFSPVVISPNSRSEEEAPVFLLYEKNFKSKVLSLMCIQIWGSDVQATKYEIDFLVSKADSFVFRIFGVVKRLSVITTGTQKPLRLKEAKELELGNGPVTIPSSLMSYLAHPDNCGDKWFL